jgi:hypothetical protein
MFFRAIQSIRSKQCILPQAVTPVQKTGCVLTGLLALGLSSCILYKGYGFAHDYYNHIIKTREKDLVAYKGTRKEKPIAFPKEIEQLRKKITVDNILGILAFCVSGTFTCGLTYSLYYLTKYSFHSLRHTSQCCNIIRGTALYGIGAPFLSIGIVCWSLITIAIYDSDTADEMEKNIRKICYRS